MVGLNENGKKAYYYYESSGYMYHWTKSDDNLFTVDENNFFHSYNDEPAEIWYEKNGDKIKNSEEWFYNGYRHRLNDPAKIIYINGKIGLKEYYIHGKQLTKEEWEIEVNRLEMLQEI